MVEAVFVVNLVLALLGVGACLWHAYPDRGRVALLATGVVYGVLLEQLVILHFEAYHYDVGDFLLTVGDVPVVIGLGWAAILYAGFEIGRGFGVPGRALPAFVALFALHIDLAMDAVAIRVPFWTWTPPGPWFGVPLGNFTGWFLVASLFTAAWLALSDRLLGVSGRAPSAAASEMAADLASVGAGSVPAAVGSWPVLAAIGAGSVVSAVAGLIVLLEAWSTLATTLPRKVAILGGVILAAVGLIAREGVRPAPVDPRLVAVPALYHGYYLALLLLFEMHREQPLLLVVSLSMIGIGVAFHLAGSRRASATPGVGH